MNSSDLCFATADFSQAEWSALVAESPDINLLQTWAYGEAKAAEGPWQALRGVVRAGAETVGAAQILVRRVPVVGGGLAWLNRGPILFADGGDRRGGMIRAVNAVKAEVAGRKGLYLRIAPPVSAEAVDAAFLAATGLMDTGVPGWASARLDLTVDEAALRGGLNGKWRGHLSKAERNDLEVTSGTDATRFATFRRLYADMLAEKSLATTMTPEFFAAFQDRLPDAEKMLVYVCTDGEAPLGAMLIVRYGRIGEYLATTTTAAGRRLNAGQLMLWRAIVDLKAAGYTALDLSGVDPLQTPKGILTFKQGVGGVPYRLAPEMETRGGGPVRRAVRWQVQRSRLQVL